MSHGSQSMVDPLRRVVVCEPDERFGAADPQRWHYTAQPDLRRAREEHAALAAVLEQSGAEVIRVDLSAAGSADAIYVHDPCIVTDAGAILLNMGKTLRRQEPAALGAALAALGVPVLGALEGEQRAEGGDLLWLDRRTLAVGQGYRTNAAGLARLRALLEPLGVEALGVELPHAGGPAACLHLMSLISLVDDDLAVVYSPLLSAPFRERLVSRGMRLVEVPAEEFGSMGPNVLALAPRDCLMLAGNPLTRQRLEKAGCRVRIYEGREISLKAEGGPTCLTRPILRRRD